MATTQPRPHALPGSPYESFGGKEGTGVGAHPVGRLTAAGPHALPIQLYGSFAGKASAVVVPPIPEPEPTPTPGGGFVITPSFPLTLLPIRLKGRAPEIGIEVARGRLVVDPAPAPLRLRPAAVPVLGVDPARGSLRVGAGAAAKVTLPGRAPVRGIELAAGRLVIVDLEDEALALALLEVL